MGSPWDGETQKDSFTHLALATLVLASAFWMSCDTEIYTNVIQPSTVNGTPTGNYKITILGTFTGSTGGCQRDHDDCHPYDYGQPHRAMTTEGYPPHDGLERVPLRRKRRGCRCKTIGNEWAAAVAGGVDLFQGSVALVGRGIVWAEKNREVTAA